MSDSVNLPLRHKVQKFSSGTGSPGDPGKRAVKRLWCGGGGGELLVMATLCNRAGHYILALWFLHLLSSFFLA